MAYPVQSEKKKFSISLNNTSSAKPADLCILSMEKVAISQFQADWNYQQSKLMAPSVSSEKNISVSTDLYFISQTG